MIWLGGIAGLLCNAFLYRRLCNFVLFHHICENFFKAKVYETIHSDHIGIGGECNALGTAGIPLRVLGL